MATIGLDKLYYATITENPDTGEETYATPNPSPKPSAQNSVLRLLNRSCMPMTGHPRSLKNSNPAP